jgi:hypothetical protein
MADEPSLRFIGFTLGAVAAAVTLIAATLVITVDRTAFDKSATTTISASTSG